MATRDRIAADRDATNAGHFAAVAANYAAIADADPPLTTGTAADMPTINSSSHRPRLTVNAGQLRCTTMLVALLLTVQACGVAPVVLDVELPGEPVVLLTAGDIADCRHVPAADSGAEKTAQRIERELRRSPDARVLTLGDNTYPVGRPEEFNHCYHPTWGRFKERTLPTPGNHDYYTRDAAGYYGYFGAQAGPAGKGYYATTIGSWKLIALNSALPKAEFAAQLQWLKAELGGDRRLCTLAFFHHPPFSSGGHGDNARIRPLWELLVDAGVDLVLTGHDHHYERFAPMNASGAASRTGARLFIVGTGGTRHSWLSLPAATTEARNNDTLGILKLELRNGGYSWEFLAATSSTFTDRGHGLCH